MLKPNQVPYEVKLRLRAVLYDGECDEAVAIAAALSAWPGAEREVYANAEEGVFLPLPTENTNAEG